MRLLGFLTFFILTWNLEVQAWESWSPEEMDIFDLVEEVVESKQNFYEYMELTQEATTSEVRKAYRKLSLVLHPDKNDAEDAEIKFRWFVTFILWKFSIFYETLLNICSSSLFPKVSKLLNIWFSQSFVWLMNHCSDSF